MNARFSIHHYESVMELVLRPGESVILQESITDSCTYKYDGEIVTHVMDHRSTGYRYEEECYVSELPTVAASEKAPFPMWVKIIDPFRRKDKPADDHALPWLVDLLRYQLAEMGKRDKALTLKFGKDEAKKLLSDLARANHENDAFKAMRAGPRAYSDDSIYALLAICRTFLEYMESGSPIPSGIEVQNLISDAIRIAEGQ